MCGESEGSTFEDELEEAHAAHATLSAEQTAQAIEEVKSFMANNGVFFNGYDFSRRPAVACPLLMIDCCISTSCFV